MLQKSIIFDCDGVLVDSEIIYNAIERKHLAKLGLTYTDWEYQQRFVGLSNTDFVNALSTDYQSLTGKTFPADFEHIISQESERAFETDLVAISGADEFIASLNNPCAVASSSKLRMLHKKLTLTALNHHFGSHVYSTEQVINGKPSPDIFLHAARQLDVEPGDCIVIEDSANGIKAGLEAGMQVWGFTGGQHADAGMADRLSTAGAEQIFGSYASLAEHISINP